MTARQTKARWLHGTYAPTTGRRWWVGVRHARWLEAVGGYVTLSWGIAGRGRYIGLVVAPTLAAQLRRRESAESAKADWRQTQFKPIPVPPGYVPIPNPLFDDTTADGES